MNMRSIKNRLLLKGRKNKKSIITMMLALVTMTELVSFSLMLHTDVSLTARFYELMMASVKLIRGWNACANLAFA